MDLPARPSDSTLLANVDPHPVRILNQESTQPILLVCDHASNYVPRNLGNLGLSDVELQRHIAWDRGSGQLTEILAKELGFKSVLCNYSRIVIDCNRKEHDPSLILEVSDGTVVPGNQGLSQQQKQARMNGIYEPYHAAITRAIDELQQVTVAPAVVAVHSFTPKLKNGQPRPWHVGILWDKDARLAVPMLEYFRSKTDFCVGDNQPYSGKHPADYTIDYHAEGRGLPCVSLEIRQDLLDAEGGVEQWAEHLAKLLASLQHDESIYDELRP